MLESVLCGPGDRLQPVPAQGWLTRMLMETMLRIWAEGKRGESDAYTQMEMGFKTTLTGWEDEPDGKRM